MTTTNESKLLRKGKPRGTGRKAWHVTLRGPAQGKTGRFIIRFKEPGTGDRNTSSATTRDEAHRRFDDVELALDDAERGVVVPKDATVAEAVACFLANYLSRVGDDLSKGSYSNAETNCRLHIVPVIGHVLLREWTPAHCQDVVNVYVTKGNRDTNKLRSHLAQIVADAHESKLLHPSINPLGPTKKRTRKAGGTQGASTRYVPPKQRPDSKTVDKLIGEAELIGERRNMPWLPTMFGIAAKGGLRFSELMGLTPDHYDSDTNELTVETTIEEREGQRRSDTKNGLVRTVPLPGSLHEAMTERATQVRSAKAHGERFALGGGSGLLFPSPRGLAWSRNSWWTLVYQPACLAIGWTKPGKTGNPVPYLRWHTMRHHCATWWSTPKPHGPGLRWEEISVRLGHSSVRVTLDIYVNPSELSSERIRTDLAAF